MKKWIGMLLSACMVFSLLTFAVSANSADPITIQEGDVIRSEVGWFHVRPAADGNYTFPEKNVVHFVVRPTKDVSGLSDAEIDYLHAKLVAEVYEILIDNAEESIRNAEQDVQKAKDSLPEQRASLEADRKIIRNLEQIENLVQELSRRQRENKLPIGFLSIESWYRLSVRPRLIMLGYSAPEV